MNKSNVLYPTSILYSIISSHEYCKDFPKESLRSMLSTIANEQSCKLTSDQEDDIMKALCHHSVRIFFNILYL